jgi:hypothetical protein
MDEKKQAEERCRVCHREVRVNIRRGTGICCGDCEDIDMSRQGARELGSR